MPGGSAAIAATIFVQDSPLLSASVNLTSAQLSALLGTPVNLVPAPGVGFRIVVALIIIRFFGGSVAYTDAGGAVSFAIGSANLALASNAIFLVTVSPNRRIETVGWAAETLDTAANPPTDDNAPMTISKATNNLAAGNGTARITTYYTIEATT